MRASLLSAFAIRETRDYVSLEDGLVERSPRPSWRTIILRTSLLDRSLSAASQAGLVNNLNDGMAWGLLPLYYAAAGLSLTEIAMLAAAYPLTWGTSQLATGALSDRIGRKGLIVGGLLVQAVAIAAIAATSGFWPWFAASVALGLGTGMVYPTLLAAVADVADPSWRGSALGVYRMWRDLGFAVGAILVGVTADRAGMGTAIAAVAAITAASGVVVAVRMRETHPRLQTPPSVTRMPRVTDAGRVIAGSARGVRLVAPGEGTRPLADRVKQTLFAILEPDLDGARVLDLFAGSGAGRDRGAVAGRGVGHLRREGPGRGGSHRREPSGDRARRRPAVAIVRWDVVRWLAEPNVGESLRHRPRRPAVRGDRPPCPSPGAASVSQRLRLRPGARVVAKHFWRDRPPDRIGMLASERDRRFGETALTFYRREEER